MRTTRSMVTTQKSSVSSSSSKKSFSSLFALISSADSDSSAASGFPRLPDDSSSEESEEEDDSLSLSLVSLGICVDSPYFSSMDLTGKRKPLVGSFFCSFLFVDIDVGSLDPFAMRLAVDVAFDVS